jgi:uncharacterized membrane protein
MRAGVRSLLFRLADADPERFFVALALCFGLWSALVTPPLQVPDEQVHLFRSYQLSRLDVFKPRDEVPGDLLAFLGRFGRLMTHPERKTSLAELEGELATPIDPVRPAEHYTSDLVLAYAPQAAGVLVARLTSGSALAMVYLGRLFNLLAYVALVAAAIRIAPAFRWTLLVLALMPMSIHLAASLSYDAPTIGLSFLFVALVLRAARDESPLGRHDLAALFACAWALALVKQPYLLLAFAFLLIPVARMGSLRRYLPVFAALVASSVIVSVAWSGARAAACSSGLLACRAPAPGPSAAQVQLLAMLRAPDQFGHVLLGTLRHFGPYWIVTMVGASLGWLDTALPRWVSQVYPWLLPVVALTDAAGSPRLGLARRTLLAGSFAGFLLLIPTLLYLFDPRINPAGAPIILGVQGRYFIPVAPLALLALPAGAPGAARPTLEGARRLATLAVVVAALIAAAATVYRRFYLP